MTTSSRYWTVRELIAAEIIPTLGEFADDYDLEGIAGEMSEFDGCSFVVRDEYSGDDGCRAYYEMIERFVRK